MASARTKTLLHHLRRLAAVDGPSGPSDGELLHRFVTAADEGAFEVLLLRHGPMALRVCRRVLGNHHDAEEAFQATFLTLARKAAVVRRQESVGSFVYGVAYRQALNLRAARARRAAHESQAVPRAAASPLDEITLREAREALDAELSQLPERFRAPLVLCCLEGLARDEAAHRLGLPLGTLKTRLERGRQLLHARLTRRGLTLTAALSATLLGEGQVRADLPGPLLHSTLRATVGSRAPAAAASVVAPPTAPALAGVRLKVGTVLFLAAGLVAAGTALLGRPHPAIPPPGAEPSPAARPEVGDRPRVRTDAHGDPLPEGALFRLGTVRFRHPGSVTAVALSSDGKTLATEGSGTIRLWDATTGKPGPVLVDPEESYGAGQNPLAFSPDGRRLFFPNNGAFRQNGHVAARDLTTGQTDVVLAVGPGTKIHAVHPSPDGRLLAVGTSAGVRVLDLASGRISWTAPNGAEASRPRDDRLLFHGPYSLALFSPDGKVVAVNASDAPTTLRLLDPDGGKERRRIELGARLVRPAFSPDGARVAVTERDNAVRVYDVATGRRLHSWAVTLTNPNENYTCAVAFSPDGFTLAVGATDNAVHRWDLRSGRELTPLRGHVWYVTGLVFSADGRRLFSVSWDGTIRRWDTGTGQEERVAAEAATGTVARSPVGSILAWEEDGGVLHLSDAATGKTLRTLPAHPGGVSYLAFSPDGSVLAAGGGLWVQLWDVATGKVLRRWSWPKGKDPHACVNDLTFTPDGERLATASMRSNEVLLWDARTGDRLARAPHQMAEGVVFTPDGRTLVSAGWDRALRWWAVPELRPLDAVLLREQMQASGPLSDPRFEALARSPDGRLLATINLGGGISVWDALDRKRLHSFEATAGQCNLTFSPDGQWLSTGGYSGDVALWDVRTGQQVLKLAGHPARVFTVAFSPDGRTLLTGSDDRTALAWDLRPRSGPRDDRGVGALWDALGGADAPAAYRALWRLADHHGQSVPFLRGKLSPAEPPDPKRLRELLDALDSDRFAEREAASRALAGWGEVVEPELQRELGQTPSVEKRHRLRMLLDGLAALPSPDAVQQARAVVALQWADTPEARRLLEELAGGAPGARLTQEAKAALRRLSGR
jgi:RNA polymerase sigma factor (sigma-70 family)